MPTPSSFIEVTENWLNSHETTRNSFEKNTFWRDQDEVIIIWINDIGFS